MKFCTPTLLSYLACLTTIVQGTIVYPVIVNGRSGGNTKPKLVLTPTHSLEMEKVSLFGNTYIERMEINGTVMDLLLDSAILQKNMYECRQNIATYTVNFLGGSMYVEGIVNTTHAIRPMKQGMKRMNKIPHKLFSILKNASATFSKPIEAQLFESLRRRHSRRRQTRHLRNATVSSQRIRAEERSAPSNAAQQSKLARDLQFEIEVHCIVDAVLHAEYNYERRMAVYVATLMNVVKLKIRTMRFAKMSVRVVGIRSLGKDYENEVVVLNDEMLDIDKTLSKLANYVRIDPLLSRADIVVLLTGRHAASYKKGVNPNYMGLAYVGQVCSQDWKVAIVEDKKAQYQAAVTLAHEIGHLLGAPHDGTENKKYSECASSGAIMAPHIDGQSGHHFSDCAEKAIKDNLEKMTENQYWHCICVKNLEQDFLEVQKRLPPPTYNHEDFCKATEGSNLYYAEFKNCILHCYVGGFWSGWPSNDYPAPYGFRCEKGMICMFGECVSCKEHQPEWKDCEKY